MQLADAEGIEAVTLRRLAKDLGVTPMALYWHIPNKDSLLDALVDRVIQEVDLTADLTAPWPQQLRTLMTRIIEALRAHPWTVALLPTRSLSRGWLRATEHALEILTRAGFSNKGATHIARHAHFTVIGLVSGELGYPAGPLAHTDVEARQRDAFTVLRALPSEEFPNVIGAAHWLTACEEPEAYYRVGLNILITGIEAMAGQHESLYRTLRQGRTQHPALPAVAHRRLHRRGPTQTQDPHSRCADKTRA
jgi:AcrR family transcriptional regulator